MQKLFILLSVFFFSMSLSAQTAEEKEAYKKQYEFNIKQSRIDGTYIPSDLDDAIREIKDLSPAEGLSGFAGIEDEWEAASKIHFGLGRWIVVNWNFYDGSRLSHLLKEQGILHPDDMAKFILISLHRNLNNKNIEPEPLIEKLAEERKKMAEHLIEKKTKL